MEAGTEEGAFKLYMCTIVTTEVPIMMVYCWTVVEKHLAT